MAVRCRTQCRRTAPRASVASGVCISDLVLSLAIEWYTNGSPTLSRRLSSHNGPTESRRRLGKRHMTGVMASSPTFLPTWHFEVIPNTTMWQWQAPTSPEERKAKKHYATPSGLFNNFLSWLEQSDADKPFLTLPGEGTTKTTCEAVAAAPTIVEAPAPHHGHIPEELLRLYRDIGRLTLVDERHIVRVCRVCRKSMQARVDRGSFSLDDLAVFMEPSKSFAQRSFASPYIVEKAAAMIRRGVISAFVVAHARSPTLVSKELWLALAAHTLSSEASNANVVLFAKMMEAMPLSYREHIPAVQIHGLCQSFVKTQASRHNLFSHWSVRNKRFGKALSGLSKVQWSYLDDAMLGYLEQDVHMSDINHRERLAWLSVRTYGSASREATDLPGLYDALLNTGKSANSFQLWQLVVARLDASGILDGEESSNLVCTGYHSMAQRWASLVHTLTRSSQPNAVTHLRTYVEDLGAMDVFMRGLLSMPANEAQSETFRIVAVEFGDHRLAVKLHDAMNTKTRLGRRPRQWQWTAWTNYIEAMINDATIECRLWQFINLRTPRSSLGRRTNSDMEDTLSMMKLLDRIARSYIQASHLTDRQVLRRLQQCAHHQRALTNSISPELLVIFMEIITRDLEQGNWGRATRMQWLVRMVEEVKGIEDAKSVLSTLEGWRSMVARAHQDEL